MANRNGMGPDEKGPKTGRKMGNCNITEEPQGPEFEGVFNKVLGTGRGKGRGLGRGKGLGLGRNFTY